MGDFALAAGGGVSQGFAQGQLARQKLEQEREELGLRRKQLESTIKLQELQGFKLLSELQNPEVSQQLINLFQQAIGGGPEGGAAPITSEIQETPEEQIFTSPSPRQVPAQAGPRLTGPAGTGGFRLIPSLTTNERGGTSLTFKAEPIEPKIGETTLFMGGQPVRVQVRTNPVTGQVDVVPLGQGEPTAQTEQAMRIVSGFGLPESHPLRDQLLNRVVATFNLSPEIRDQELINIQRDARTALQGQAPAMGDLGAARQEAQESKRQFELRREVELTKAKNLADLQTKPLSSETQRRVQLLMSAERQGELARNLFRPQFVGKGFQAYTGALKKEIEKFGDPLGKDIAPGAIAGALREFMGNISPEEATFRAAVNDFADIILRARSGAQINETEFKRMKGFLFNLLDEPAAFVPRMNRVLLEVGKNIEDSIGLAITPGPELLRERERKLEIQKIVPMK